MRKIERKDDERFSDSVYNQSVNRKKSLFRRLINLADGMKRHGKLLDGRKLYRGQFGEHVWSAAG